MQQLAKSLDDLLDEVRQHFACEEQWMLQTGYPHTTEHCSEHRRLLAELGTMRGRLTPTRLPLVRAYLSERLPEWLEQHLRGIDSTLSAYLLRVRQPSD